MEMLQARTDKIQSEFDILAAQREEARILLQTYEGKMREIEQEARHIIRDATAQGRRVGLEIQGEAQAQAGEILAQAKSEMGEEFNKARIRLKNDVVQMVLQVTEKLLHQKLDDEGHKRLITDLVEEAK